MARRPNPVTASTTFRVYRVSKSLRTRMDETRTTRKQTLREFIETAVESELPKIIKGLGEAGIEPMDGDAKPARWPMTDAVLSELRAASEQVGIPGTTLLTTCLRLSVRRKRVRRQS